MENYIETTQTNWGGSSCIIVKVKHLFGTMRVGLECKN